MVTCKVGLLTIVAGVAAQQPHSSHRRLRQSRAVGKCTQDAYSQTPYCKMLATMGKAARDDETPQLYDEYHKLGGGGLQGANKTANLGSVEILRTIRALFPPPRQVFEGGPGNCWLLRTLQSDGYTVRGQEASAYAIQKYCDGLDVHQGLLKQTSFGAAIADVVMAFDVMEHIPLADIAPVFAELKRLGKPGTFVLLNVGVCATMCSSGFCRDQRIHVTGLCQKWPRAWWESQLKTAGLALAPESIMERFEALLVDWARKTDLSDPECHPKSKKAIKCRTPWNNRGHNFFVAQIP